MISQEEDKKGYVDFSKKTRGLRSPTYPFKSITGYFATTVTYLGESTYGYVSKGVITMSILSTMTLT